MADIRTSLQNGLKIDGSLGIALVDYESGMSLGTAGNAGFDLELAAAGNSDVVRAKKRIRDKLGLKDKIEDILITLTGQYHLIRMVGTTMFIYIVLDRSKSNLAMARKELEAIERNLEIERTLPPNRWSRGELALSRAERRQALTRTVGNFELPRGCVLMSQHSRELRMKRLELA